MTTTGDNLPSKNEEKIKAAQTKGEKAHIKKINYIMFTSMLTFTQFLF